MTASTGTETARLSFSDTLWFRFALENSDKSKRFQRTELKSRIGETFERLENLDVVYGGSELTWYQLEQIALNDTALAGIGLTLVALCFWITMSSFWLALFGTTFLPLSIAVSYWCDT